MWSIMPVEVRVFTRWRAGYGFAGPAMVSTGRAHEMERPSTTHAADARRTSGVTKLSVPSSSSSPHRPQLRKRVGYSRYSSAVGGVRSARPTGASPLVDDGAQANHPPAQMNFERTFGTGASRLSGGRSVHSGKSEVDHGQTETPVGRAAPLHRGRAGTARGHARQFLKGG